MFSMESQGWSSMELQSCISMPTPMGGHSKRQAGILGEQTGRSVGELKKKVCVRDENSCPALPCLQETGNNRQQGRGRSQAKPALQPQYPGAALLFRQNQKTGLGTQNSQQVSTHPRRHPGKIKNKAGKTRAPRSPRADRAAGTWAESPASAEARIRMGRMAR